MKVMECQTYEELSQKAARITAATIKDKPDAVLGFSDRRHAGRHISRADPPAPN